MLRDRGRFAARRQSIVILSSLAWIEIEVQTQRKHGRRIADVDRRSDYAAARLRTGARLPHQGPSAVRSEGRIERVAIQVTGANASASAMGTKEAQIPHERESAVWRNGGLVGGKHCRVFSNERRGPVAPFARRGTNVPESLVTGRVTPPGVQMLKFMGGRRRLDLIIPPYPLS